MAHVDPYIDSPVITTLVGSYREMLGRTVRLILMHLDECRACYHISQGAVEEDSDVERSYLHSHMEQEVYPLVPGSITLAAFHVLIEEIRREHRRLYLLEEKGEEG